MNTRFNQFMNTAPGWKIFLYFLGILFLLGVLCFLTMVPFMVLRGRNAPQPTSTESPAAIMSNATPEPTEEAVIDLSGGDASAPALQSPGNETWVTGIAMAKSVGSNGDTTYLYTVPGIPDADQSAAEYCTAAIPLISAEMWENAVVSGANTACNFKVAAGGSGLPAVQTFPTDMPVLPTEVPQPASPQDSSSLDTKADTTFVEDLPDEIGRALLTPTKVVTPIAPWQWIYMKAQDYSPEWLKNPDDPSTTGSDWARIYQRPLTAVVFDASAAGYTKGYLRDTVMILCLGAETQRPVFYADGQAFVFAMTPDRSFAEIQLFARKVALHTGSSRQASINYWVEDTCSQFGDILP